MTSAKARGLVFLGVRTDKLEATRAMFERLLGMTVFVDAPSFVALRLPDGGVVEIFGDQDSGHAHFDSGPVAGFEVEDLEKARAELIEEGIEMLSPVIRGSHGDTWIHFRGPDGNVYELLQHGAGT